MTQQAADIYTPTGCFPLSDMKEQQQQIRLGLQGYPKTGKTFAALTFPNPVVLNFDRGLGAHIGRTDVINVPFYDDAFIDKMCPKLSPLYIPFGTTTKMPRPSNRKDALLKWLYSEAAKLTSSQTLIIDGNTKIQAAYHTEYWTAPELDQQGKLKPYVEFRKKIDFFTEIAVLLTGLKCHVVYISHESDDRNDKGELNGKIRPLMSGAFKDEIQSHFTDWFRCIAMAKPSNADELAKCADKFKVSKETVQEWMQFSTNETMYLWQTTADNDVDCGTTLDKAPKLIPAHYSMFAKYQRKIS